MVAKHSKISRAVQAAIVYLFGGKRANGFVSSSQAQQAGRPITANLRTQKDGRLFALDLLKRIEGPAHNGEFSAVDSQTDEEGTYHFPPQSPMIREAFDRIYQADEQARLGFFVVMSEYIGQSVVGHLSEGVLEQWEAEGRMREVQAAGAASQEPGTADAYEGIPPQHHRAVQARLMAAVVDGKAVSPQEAYRDLLEKWRQLAKTGGEKEQAAIEEAARFHKRAGITVEDHAWGALFTGSKAALIKAGLASAKLIPAKDKEKNYTLPLNHHDGYVAACYGPTWGKIPPSWSAKIARALGRESDYSVWVEFNMDERNVRERAAPAIAEVDSPAPNLDLLRELVRAIPPRPLSVVIPEAIKRAKHYGKAGGGNGK